MNNRKQPTHLINLGLCVFSYVLYRGLIAFNVVDASGSGSIHVSTKRVTYFHIKICTFYMYIYTIRGLIYILTQFFHKLFCCKDDNLKVYVTEPEISRNIPCQCDRMENYKRLKAIIAVACYHQQRVQRRVKFSFSTLSLLLSADQDFNIDHNRQNMSGQPPLHNFFEL